MNPAARRLALLLACVAPAANAQAWRVEAPDDLAARISPFLGESTGRQAADSLGKQILATEGYFTPRVAVVDADGGLVLKIDPGPRTQVSELDLAVDGPVDEKTRAALIAGWLLPVGQPFRQEDWNNAKQQILGELLAADHAAARLVDSQAAIDAATQRAALSAHYDAGPRHRYGALRIDGLHRFDAALIARYNHEVEVGKPYRAADLRALTARLQETPYFASARASLDLDAAEPDATGEVIVPVRLRVRERPGHRAAFGAGFSSNTGARVEASYQTPNFLDQAWDFSGGLRLEQKRQTVYGDVMLPPDRSRRQHGFGFAHETSDIEDLRTERIALGVQSIQQRGSVEQRLSLNWQRERRIPDGAETVVSRALVANATWTWRQVDDLLDPRSGLVVQLSLGGAARALLSDEDFLRLHGRIQYYLPLGARDTLTLRGELGRTFAADRLHVPQDYLFRTGGTGSVRGYAYQSLGIREGDATVGGRYLAVASAEVTHWLNDSWGIAAFVDAGDAVDALTDARLAVGYGIGARWRSPAGPIGADLAYGQRERGVQLHFSLAIPF